MAFFLFAILAALAVAGGLVMILHRNPVISALALAVSFLAVAGLYIQLDAELMGIFQVLVYAGAIMVLFLFIIMLLDIKGETRSEGGQLARIGAGLLAALFLLQMGAVLMHFDAGQQPLPKIDTQQAIQARAASVDSPNLATTSTLLADDQDLPDAHLLGEALFGRYLLPLQIIAVLLLVASVGVVMLTKKQGSSTASAGLADGISPSTTSPDQPESSAASKSAPPGSVGGR